MNLTKSFFDNLDNKQFQLQIGEEEYLELKRRDSASPTLLSAARKSLSL